MNPHEQFGELVHEFRQIPGVAVPTEGRGFGSDALRFRGKIFAMLVRDRLVVKLPEQRVEALLAAGAGVKFDANRGTPMKEWFSLDPGSDLIWSSLAREALAFISRK
jgi:hypothetical protein